jgi:hypothetical protein
MVAATRDVLVRCVGVEAHTLPDGSVLLYEARTGTAFPLNESGGRIWEICAEAHTADEIIDLLSEQYEAPRSDLERDTRDFLAVLIGHGLLYRQSPGS